MKDLVKRALRKAINRTSLTVIQFLTVLKEVETVINSRSLVYVSDGMFDYVHWAYIYFYKNTCLNA